jgi:uncharacterized cupredoxin-like copper-binding protein
MPSLIKSSLVAAGVLCTGLSFAHGGADHSAGRTAGPAGQARVEQRPWGVAGSVQAVRRTIAVKMTDAMRFEPDHVEVKQGETVRLLVTNGGQLQHEMVIGTRKSLDQHAALMARFPEMEHEEPYGAHVAPGKTGEIVWQFNRAGRFDFACLVAGHYQAGMVGTLNVIAP